METLPPELQIQVCSYLPRADLLTINRTCTSLAAAAKPLLFETLIFHGDDHTSETQVPLRNPRSVELASLESAVDRVRGLGITKYVKTFQYSPKIYVEGFWSEYRDWVEDQLDETLDSENMGYESDAWDEDEEWSYVGLRRQAEARINRPEKERELIEKAESYWNAKVLEQEQRKNNNHSALVCMFRSMPILSSIDILEWSCASELREHGIVEKIDEDVECQFSKEHILNVHVETLSSALQGTGSRIKHLLLPAASGQAILPTPAVQHLFSALTYLSLDLDDAKEMLAHYKGRSPSIQALIRCARNTLERLEFSKPLYTHHLPYPGERMLEKLWGDDTTREDGILVFPRLKYVQITTLILYAPSLINFLRVQPALESVVFANVYVQTPGYGWSDVAAALPPTCRFLRIHLCGGQATPKIIPDPPPNPDMAYSYISLFTPQKSTWPASCGWRISDAFIRRRAEQQTMLELSVVRQQLINDICAAQQGLESSTGRPLSELLWLREGFERRFAQNVERFGVDSCDHESADFERIP